MIGDRFTFTFPSWWRPIFGCGVAVSCFFVVLGITLLFLRPSVEVIVMGALAVLIFGPVGWVCLDAWRRRDERIEVGPADITLFRTDGSRLSMPWDSIVEVRDRTLLWRLDVIDTRRRVIKIEYQVEGFANLCGIILERAACLGGQSPRVAEFHRSSLGGWPGAVLLALLGGGTAVLLVTGELSGAALCGLFLIIVGAALFGEIHSVKVGPRDVVLQHFLLARRIPYTDIAGIDLEDVAVNNRYEVVPTTTVPTVIIVTHRGEEITLPTFPEGRRRVFDSLAAAWEQGKAGAVEPPGQAR